MEMALLVVVVAFLKKRKKWSPEELFAAVKPCGEGNWAHIVKGSASQLSQVVVFHFVNNDDCCFFFFH